MNINNNNVSFGGGFRFTNMPQEAKNKLPEIVKKGKQIFDNFEKEGDVFLVLKDKYDVKAQKFIKENKLKFEYYPDVNTNSGLDSEIPEGLTALIKSLKTKPIKTRSQLNKRLNANIKEIRTEENSPMYISKILKALCIDNKHPIDTKKGVKIINDTEFNRKILITPPSKNKVHYVMVQPNSINQNVERYAIDTEGNILAKYTTPDGMKIFAKKFNSLIIKK